MKIALVIDRFHPAKGGAERSLSRILSALQQRGHELHLWALSWDAALPLPMHTHSVGLPSWPRWWREWRFAQHGPALARSQGADLVVAVRHVADADVFLARGGLHCATLQAGGDHWKRFSPRHRVLLAVERALFLRPNPPLVIAPSALVQRQCTEHFGLPAQRVRVIPTGVDLHRLQPRPRPVDGKLRVLFVAHNFRLKGLPVLLQAFGQLDPQRFELWVAGRDRPPVAPPPNVRFVGEQSSMVELYQAADVLAHPTLYDPFSRVVIEALACGLPVVTSLANGAAEIITQNVEGFLLADPHDARGLAGYLHQLGDLTRRARMSQAARRLAEAYPESQWLETTVAAIESATAQCASGTTCDRGA